MNKESNIAHIEQLLAQNKDGMTFEQIKEEIFNLRGVSLGDYEYYSQVLEDMARSGSIVRNVDGKFYLKADKMELWDTPFYTFNINKEALEEADDTAKYVKNTLHETIDYDDIDDEELLEELSEEEEVEEEEVEGEPEITEETIIETTTDFDDDEFEVDDYEDEDDYYEDEDY